MDTASFAFHRHLFAAVLLLAGLLTWGSAHAAEQPQPNGWPGFMGPDRSGVVGDALIETDWQDNKPAIRWTRAVGPGFGGAAIVDEVAYIFDRDGMVGDVLKAFDLTTGEPIFAIPTKAPGRSSYHGSRCTPTIHDGFAYTVGPFGHVTGFDLTERRIAWSLHMDRFDAPPPKFAWSQSPLIVDGLVVVAPMSKQTGIAALDPKTGEVVWRSGFIGHEGYSSPRLVTLAGRRQIITLTATLVSGVDAATGKVLWTYDNIPVRRGIPTPAVLPGDKLFVTAGYEAGSALLQITEQDGKFSVKQLKRIDVVGGQVHSPLLIGEHVYVNLNTNDNLRRGTAPGLGYFDLNGNLIWQTDNQPDLNRGPLLAIGGQLITLGGEDGVLRLVEPSPEGYRETGSVKVFETRPRNNMIWAAMAYSDGNLIVRSQNELKCIKIGLAPAQAD